MFRIVQFTMDYDKLIEAGKTNEYTVRRIQEDTEIGRRGDNFVSEPMATTERRYFDIEQGLRSMFGDRIHWDVVDITDKYRLLRTRAPRAYDYGYVIEVGEMPFRPEKNETERDTERLVAIPKESVEYQSGRYASGMYMPIDCS
jgi:hypothetical protein